MGTRNTPRVVLRRAVCRCASPGGRFAASIMDATNFDICILEVERDMFRRLTVAKAVDQSLVWSPDGRWIVFASERGKSAFNLYRQLADGTCRSRKLYPVCFSLEEHWFSSTTSWTHPTQATDLGWTRS